MHHLLPLKLLSSSFNVVSISLDGSHKIQTNSTERNVGTNESLLDVYAKCAMYIESIPDIMTLNFLILQPNIKLLTKTDTLVTHRKFQWKSPTGSPHLEFSQFIL